MEEVIIPDGVAFPAGAYRLSMHQGSTGDWEIRLVNYRDTITPVWGVNHATAMTVFQSMKDRFKRQDFFPQVEKIDRIRAIREHYGPAFGLKAAKQLHESGLILTGDLVRDFSRLCERLPDNFQV
jgi:hypothetical protein